MVRAGNFYTLRVVKLVDFGAYLDGGETGEILIPKRYVPAGLRADDEIEVFIYHDSESRIIATTDRPAGKEGDIVFLTVKDITPQGAFLEWGLLKDIFLPLSQQKTILYKGMKVAVMIYVDEQTGRVAATEKFRHLLDPEAPDYAINEPVDLLATRTTDLGWEVIINNRHTGLIHFSDLFEPVEIGDRFKGYIKRIHENGKIDVMPGKKGYQRIEDETGKVLRLLQEHDGYLPYNDKSDPEDIRAFFGMSKKAFKMATGALYKQQQITFTQTGIELLDH